jgi:autotransporter-associated beta strand protein
VGSSTFNFNGGTLQAVGDQPTYLQGLDNAYVKVGGAKIDTQGYDITIAQKLRHGGAISRDGGLTKYGPGTLTLSELNSYTGDTTVNAGTLEIAGGIAPNGTSLIDIQSGTAVLKTVSVIKTNLNINTAALATFEVINGAHTVGSISGAGTTQVDAGASLTAQSIIQGTVTLGIGARITIQPIPGGPQGNAIAPVPEPSSFVLLFGAVIATICVWARKRNRQ